MPQMLASRSLLKCEGRISPINAKVTFSHETRRSHSFNESKDRVITLNAIPRSLSNARVAFPL